jgi:hypothetical protein
LNHNVGTKRSLINENSPILWHRRLSHISKERLETLVKDEILSNLYFTDFNVCVWIVLRENKPNTQRNVLQEVADF